jgi:hypothetical protein
MGFLYLYSWKSLFESLTTSKIMIINEITNFSTFFMNNSD